MISINRSDDRVVATVEKSSGLFGGSRSASLWEWEHWRDGKLLDIWKNGNITTNEGYNSLLDVYFHAATPITVWYIALFEDDYTPQATDDYAAPGFTESTAYTEATRQTWVEDPANGQSITNSTKAAFTINATKNIYGASLMSDSTKDDQVAANAVMYCAAKFTSVKPVESGDTLKVAITISMQNI
jgi:hypothetical protein